MNESNQVTDTLTEICNRAHDVHEGHLRTYGIRTGLTSVDDLCLDSGMYFIAGDTQNEPLRSLASQIEQEALIQGYGTAWVNVRNLKHEALMNQRLCRFIGASRKKIMNTGEEPEFASRVERSHRLLRNLDAHYLNQQDEISEILDWIRMMVKDHGVKFVVVDSLRECLSALKETWKPGELLNYCSGQLKRLALELDLTLIVLLPGKESVENFYDLEEFPNVAMELSESDCEEVGKPIRKMVLDVVKNQNGPVGRYELTYKAPVYVFENASD